MALVNGDMVVAAGVFPQPAGGGAADLSKGTLCPDGVVLGTFNGAALPSFVRWNNGRTDGGSTYSSNNLRKVVPYSGPALLGKAVTLSSVSAAFQGVVVFCFDVELDATDGDGTPEPVCVVKAQGFYYIAKPSSLEEL
jgi:hypothetical protein